MCGVSLRGMWRGDSQGGERWWRRGWRRNWGGGGGGRIFANCMGGEIKKITMYLVVLLKLRILEARQLSVQFAT